jgi:very-short-patch-repair endonuclease
VRIERNNPDVGRPDCSSRSLDARIAAIAGGRGGLITRQELLLAGLSPRGIRHRCERGALRKIHEGVYQVGHGELSPHARWTAAVLAGGPGAALSHRSAAALWGIRRVVGPVVEVTVPNKRRPQTNLRFHRAHLQPDELTTHHGIPTTTPTRTLLDLAATLNQRQLERAMDEAERLRLPDTLSLVDVVHRHPGARGVQKIKSKLAKHDLARSFTRSGLERAFTEFVEEHDLPRPITNLIVQGFECDAVWPEHRLIVELDTHDYHHTAAAFERDRERDRTLTAAGWRTVRVTGLQLDEDRSRLAEDLATMTSEVIAPPHRRR